MEGDVRIPGGPGGVLFGISWLIRRTVPSQGGPGFPGYILFFRAGSILPSLSCFRVAFRFINGRALTASWLWILVIRRLWEAFLAIPCGWWGYQPDQMMGLFLKAHCDLPTEAVSVWTLGTWITVILYETILTALHAEGRGCLFGVTRAGDPELDRVGHHHLRAGRGSNTSGAP